MTVQFVHRRKYNVVLFEGGGAMTPAAVTMEEFEVLL